ncbi:S-methyl-5'-thioadenosine phosphorylase [Candidatus Poriferisocius sp.]|uniref:S-methyl-5'-thioadenosine phosphorylase n=1 Tax=Candidatus Poriferisocius sp. TaxID=3101276 RepID=UPI003B024E50
MPEIGVIGGTGLYSLLEDAVEVPGDETFGPPSGPLSIGTVDGIEVAFLPRHGPGHRYPAHRVNYRANLWALRQAGVRAILGPCACGSLRPELAPGDVVVCDQLVDRTSGRADTYFDTVTNHVSLADPYCERLRGALLDAARAQDMTTHDGGTVVVISGPRFSTRAESRWFRQNGWDVVGMTQYPEAALAAELGICYATAALVTDYDAGLEDDPHSKPVTHDEVFAFFAENLDRMRAVLLGAIRAVGNNLPGCCDRTNGIEPPLPPS